MKEKTQKKEASEETEKYFNQIERNVKELYEISNKARKKGYDPENKVNIPLAKNMAERVDGLIGVAVPQLLNSGLSKRIHELEKEYGKLDWRVAFVVSLETAKEKFCKFKDKREAMETGIRVGLAYLTLGVVASPLEGFVELKLRKTRDGKEYFSLVYAGPIRSAGGTGAAVSVLVADYIRVKFGYAKYDPDEKEVKRFVTELYDYHDRVTNLQYLPSEKEITFLAKNLPVQIDGDASEKIEVSNYKDLDRVDTNQIRSGFCLVMGEGIAQKAPKLAVKLANWGEEMGMSDWNFIQEFVKLQKKVKAKSSKKETKEKISPDYTFIKDLVAGRPVLTHPLRVGGFRLRFGRSRTSGYSASSIHPATMQVLNDYIGIGTQLKVERPGKAASMTSCDTIEGPIVKLNNGDVVFLETEKKAKEHKTKVKEILFLGDILFNYGDFFNRAHSLVPPGYCEEWWVQEFEKRIVEMYGTLELSKLSELIKISQNRIEELLKNPFTKKPDIKEAIEISIKTKTPFHPRYTFHWKQIEKEDLIHILKSIPKAKISSEEKITSKIIFPCEEKLKQIFEKAGLPHLNSNNEFIVLEKKEAAAFGEIFNIKENNPEKIINIIKENTQKETLEIINLFSNIKIRDKSGIFVGARMGRPEKAKMRKLTGSPHTLFPVGNEGGRLRNFQSALEQRKITAEFPVYECEHCKKETIFGVCETCGKKTKRKFYCKHCGLLEEECKKKSSGDAPHISKNYRLKEIDIRTLFNLALKKLKTNTFPDLIKGVRGTSNKDHTPEHFIKGILRAKHDIYVNKDGTTRYDMTQLPITHFKPKEIKTSVEKLKEIGYDKDINGKELISEEQILELKPQDIILPACMESPDIGADKIFYNAAKFIDELLEKFYELKPYYNLSSPLDIVGHLFLVLAPHTSAAIVARVIGFSNTQSLLAHPMLHAATRRDCDGDEASVVLLADAFLNFSRNYLPDTRGATQDAPLVLTSKLTPAEVDDMVFDMDIAWKYPLEFYEACMKYKTPYDIKISQLNHKLGTPGQYEGMGFTHDTSNINSGIRCSAYKTLPSMQEKLQGQMQIADRVKAVDAPDVARLVIEKHFLRDIKGNLRKFSMQQFRCVSCNEKYRRPPLLGKCLKCNGGKIIFTISEGSIVKYLEPAISLAEKYNLPAYLKQTLDLTKLRVESLFGKDKEKQEGLDKWF